MHLCYYDTSCIQYNNAALGLGLRNSLGRNNSPLGGAAHRIRQIADRRCCMTCPTPNPSADLSQGCPQCCLALWYPGHCAPHLLKSTNADQRGAPANFLKLQEVSGWPWHLQTPEDGTWLPAIFKWMSAKDRAKAHAVSRQTSPPEHCLHRAVHHSNLGRHEWVLFLFHIDSSPRVSGGDSTYREDHLVRYINV